MSQSGQSRHFAGSRWHPVFLHKWTTFHGQCETWHASHPLEGAVICRLGTPGVFGGCSLARGRTRVKELAGKTAFVTGAASGIGLGIATAFAQAGAKVMLCDIEEAALSAALKQLRLTNVDVDGVKADVSLKDELVAAAEATTARYGKVHILVNNAGVGGGGPYGAWTDASWNWTMGVNLMATIWGIEIFGPLIEQHGEGGHIVSTASIAGLISGESNAYNVSKYGVVALSEGLRREL